MPVPWRRGRPDYRTRVLWSGRGIVVTHHRDRREFRAYSAGYHDSRRLTRNPYHRRSRLISVRHTRRGSFARWYLYNRPPRQSWSRHIDPHTGFSYDGLPTHSYEGYVRHFGL